MSSNSFLRSARKTDLVELARHTGLENFQSFKKSELEVALDHHLSSNPALFTSDPKVASFYTQGGASIVSPIKSDEDGSVGKARALRRRATRAAPEGQSPAAEENAGSSSSTALTQTPGPATRRAVRIPPPPSPADVAEAVNHSRDVVLERVTSLYKPARIYEAALLTRQALSDVLVGIMLVSVFELYFLREEVLPNRYAFTIPAIASLHTKDHPVWFPNLFKLLSSSFWSPVSVWSLTGFVLPAVAGFLFNLTAARAPTTRRVGKAAGATQPPECVVDPLTFSIVKAVLCFVVYGQKVTFGGWISPKSIERINSTLYGGWRGVLAGTAITALLSIYDAILRR